MSTKKTCKQHESCTSEVMCRLDDIRESTAKLIASFEAHLKQDESFYVEVKEMARGQLQIADRLSEYNTQLQLHIAGVNELREQTCLMRDQREQDRKEFEIRLRDLEAHKSYRAILAQNIKIFASFATITTAAVAILKLIFHIF